MKRALGFVAFILLMAAPSLASAPQRSQPVHANVVIGFANQAGNHLTLAGIVTGQPFGRGALSGRATQVGSEGSGSAAIFDGRGKLSGILETTLADDGQTVTGRFLVQHGTGRYRRATGTLRFTGMLDGASVPAVVVLAGHLDGNVRLNPAGNPSPSQTAIKIAYAGEQAKVKAVPRSGMIDLTSAATTSMQGLGPGAALLFQTVSPARMRAVTWTFYGPSGRWQAKGVRNLDSGAPTRMTVTGGTGRYKGAHGSVRYTITDDGGPSGHFAYEMNGTLRF